MSAKKSAQRLAQYANLTIGLFISLGFALNCSASSAVGTYLSQQIEICGLFQREDFRPSVVTSLIDFTTYPGMAKSYTVTNADTRLVSGLVTGQCYCLVGVAEVDPAYSGDSLFQLLNVTQFVRGPYVGCMLGNGSHP